MSTSRAPLTLIWYHPLSLLAHW